MPVAGATHAGPLALIQRKQTFEQLQDTAKLQAPSATALGDLASLLEIIKDLPAGTKSSRKLIEQVSSISRLYDSFESSFAGLLTPYDPGSTADIANPKYH